jgi:putative membrane protein
MLTPSLKRNDKQANIIIWTVSVAVFALVALTSKFKLELNLGFNVHLFALMNAIINSTVTVLLVLGLMTAKQKNFEAHKKIMLTAILLSSLFLLSYVGHHLLAGETKYGGAHDARYYAYIFILATHIPLATIILPFALFTAYRALTGDYEKHKKLTRYTWPLWFYVSVTGVLVYYFISPYYVPHI